MAAPGAPGTGKWKLHAPIGAILAPPNLTDAKLWTTGAAAGPRRLRPVRVLRPRARKLPFLHDVVHWWGMACFSRRAGLSRPVAVEDDGRCWPYSKTARTKWKRAKVAKGFWLLAGPEKSYYRCFNITCLITAHSGGHDNSNDFNFVTIWTVRNLKPSC